MPNHDLEGITIHVMDFETDPFEYGIVPQPFAVGLASEDTYEDHFGDGDSCVAWIINRILALPPKSIVYAHNGGKFDYHYMASHMSGKMVVINGRIAKAYIGHVEIRDSYALFPFPLKKLQVGRRHKLEIDYNKMKRDVRHLHKSEIRDYLREDCEVLLLGLQRFIQEFGLHLTMASAAMKELQKISPTEKISTNMDTLFRRFYFGGRVQCFETGIKKIPWKMYDVNSMYPAAMKDFQHPVSSEITIAKGIQDCDFARVIARNDNCLPSKAEDGSLIFTKSFGEFWATGHELRTGIDLGRVSILQKLICFKFKRTMSFTDFVNHFYGARLKAGEDGDEAMKLFYKFILNGAYGKFAQNPEDFMDWRIVNDGELLDPPWRLHSDLVDCDMYCRPTMQPKHIYLFNVATAASITGAARSILMRGIHAAKRPIYCDTDSITCSDLPLEIDPVKLGAWKFEEEGDEVAIAGKKLYAMFDKGRGKKKASKGSNLSYDEIRSVASGATLTYRNDAPTFQLGAGPRFISRTIRATV